MATHWSVSYPKTRPDIFSASVRDCGVWKGWYVFRAYPRIGDYCIECLSQDLDELIEKAHAWERGEMPDGFYGASY